MTAREKGARGIVFIDDEEQFSKSTLSKLRYDTEFADSGIAALAVSLPKAREIFSRYGLDLDALKKEIATSKKPGYPGSTTTPAGIPLRASQGDTDDSQRGWRS